VRLVLPSMVCLELAAALALHVCQSLGGKVIGCHPAQYAIELLTVCMCMLLAGQQLVSRWHALVWAAAWKQQQCNFL
jgi:hypothetical protein